jgi:hypothetical protein
MKNVKQYLYDKYFILTNFYGTHMSYLFALFSFENYINVLQNKVKIETVIMDTLLMVPISTATLPAVSSVYVNG